VNKQLPTFSGEFAMRRRQFIGWTAGSLLCFSSARMAQAQSPVWAPTKTVRILSASAGGIPDVAAWQLADKMAPQLQQPVIVENRPGAGGIAMMEAIAKSTPDGHTVGIASFVELVVNPWMFERLSYDPVRDFAPVTILFGSPLLLAAHPSVPANTVAELIGMSRAKPGTLFYGTSGAARPPHFYGERLKSMTGILMTHVPYKGGALLVAAMSSGEVPIGLEGAAALLAHVKAGKLKPLAVTGETRVAALPAVPTFAESGIEGMGMPWVGIVAPAGTPKAAVARLQQEFARALATPEIREANALAGRTTLATAPEKFAEVIRRELPEWRSVIKAAGIKPE
jgi:tripartite-type tricarboxylate transporter receptor subunit TctC